MGILRKISKLFYSIVKGKAVPTYTNDNFAASHNIEFVKINESNICYAVLPLKPDRYVLYKNTKYVGNDILKLKMVLENEYNLSMIESL